MTKRSLRQQEVVSYALLRGKLVPRDEVLKHHLGITSNNESEQQLDGNLNNLSVKQLKKQLEQKGISYSADASKADLLALLKGDLPADLEIKKDN